MSNASAIEAMLLRWGEGPSGRTVTLLLPDDTPHHPFRGLRCGPSNGQRLGCAFTLINDDETTTPVEPPSTAPEKPKGGRLAQQAGIVCGEGAFSVFLADKYAKSVVWTQEDHEFVVDPAATVRAICGVDSRREFDLLPHKGQVWETLHGEYIVWRDNP